MVILNGAIDLIIDYAQHCRSMQSTKLQDSLKAGSRMLRMGIKVGIISIEFNKGNMSYAPGFRQGEVLRPPAWAFDSELAD